MASSVDEMFQCDVCGAPTETVSLTDTTYCPICCPDHNYSFDPSEGWYFCDTCDERAPDDYWQETGLEAGGEVC